jgi:hypothetical protein
VWMVLYSGPSLRLALRHARLMRHKLRCRLWRGTNATANLWHCQRRVRFLVNMGAAPLPPVNPNAGATDAEEEVHHPPVDQPASTSGQWSSPQTADNDITATGAPPASPAISPPDPEIEPWTNSPEESEAPGGFLTSETGSWPPRTPDGRPGSSGDDSRYSQYPIRSEPEDSSPRSSIPYDWAEQLGFDSSHYLPGFHTEDGDLGDLDG